MGDSKPSAIVRDVVGTGTGILLSALMAALGHPPETSGAAGVVGQILGLLAYDKVTREGESFVSAFRREMLEHNTGDFAEQVRERAKDPAFRNLMFQALRKVQDTFDSAVVPALGVLTADYTVPTEKAPDAFFRGVSDLLCELTAHEYAALVSLVDEAASVDVDETSYVAIATRLDDKIALTPVGASNVPPREIDFDAEMCAALAQRLQRHGLARSVPNVSGVFVYDGGGASWNALVHVYPKVLRSLHSILQRAQKA
jgi:hypothetical protein